MASINYWAKIRLCLWLWWLLFLPCKSILFAQNAVSSGHVTYEIATQFTTGGGSSNAFWLTSNRYGRNSLSPTHGALYVALARPIASDSNRTWQWGYGLGLQSSTAHTENCYLQQYYLQAQWRKLRFTLGQKEEGLNLKNDSLSTGSQALGINARPIAGLRFELADWWYFNSPNDFVSLKGHLAFGLMSDGRWRQSYVSSGQPYTLHALHHQKAGYLRLGQAKHHRLNFTAGLEWGTTFGGTIYNAHGFDQQHPILRGKAGAKDFLAALTGLRTGDPTDGDGYANTAGNTVGAWVAALDYAPRYAAWRVRLYYDHFFDDHSMMFDEYGWYDGLYGVELHFPRFKPLSHFVFEHLDTRYQSGSLYHDRTQALPVQISGNDNYYNHALYQGWHHYGMALGNPLFTTPLYENDGTLSFSSNRFLAYHLGLSGTVMQGLDYRFLFTHLRSWGSYNRPFPQVQQQHSLLVELNYRPVLPPVANRVSQLSDWAFSFAFALDRGNRLGHNTSLSLGIRKIGRLL